VGQRGDPFSWWYNDSAANHFGRRTKRKQGRHISQAALFFWKGASSWRGSRLLYSHGRPEVQSEKVRVSSHLTQIVKGLDSKFDWLRRMCAVLTPLGGFNRSLQSLQAQYGITTIVTTMLPVLTSDADGVHLDSGDSNSSAVLVLGYAQPINVTPRCACSFAKPLASSCSATTL
jgi:hypothetical protein